MRDLLPYKVAVICAVLIGGHMAVAAPAACVMAPAKTPLYANATDNWPSFGVLSQAERLHVIRTVENRLEVMRDRNVNPNGQKSYVDINRVSPTRCQ